MQIYTMHRIGLASVLSCLLIGCVPGNRAAVRQTSVPITATQVQQPISITGNVIAPTTAPAPALNMTFIEPAKSNRQKAESNLEVTWSWSTSSVDYGGDLVPPDFLVGFFIRNTAKNQWYDFVIDRTASPAASWAQRIQSFHDKNAGGGVLVPAGRIFESGTWCVTLAAANTAQTGGTFIPAPGAPTSCVSIPSR